MKKKSDAGLEGRHQPIQDRARESVDKILSSAASLLDEVGIENFNTNLLAERANVRIRTVYRYFPNKFAVIVALTRRLVPQWDAWILDFYTQMADPRSDWRTSIRESKRAWLRRAREVPGALSLLQAMNATPELNELHFQIFESMSRKLAGALNMRGVRAESSKLLTISRVIINAVNSGTEVYLRLKGREAEEFWEEVSLSEEAYLERYLSDAPQRAGRRNAPNGPRAAKSRDTQKRVALASGRGR